MSSTTIHMESTNRTSTFTKVVQSIDNQCLPWVASISTVVGVVAPFFKSLFSAGGISSCLFNRTPYFMIAGVSFTIMIVSSHSGTS